MIKPRHEDSRRKDIAETSSFAVCSEDKYIPNQLATQHEAPSDMFLVQSFNWLNFIQLCEDVREGWCTPWIHLWVRFIWVVSMRIWTELDSSFGALSLASATNHWQESNSKPSNCPTGHLIHPIEISLMSSNGRMISNFKAEINKSVAFGTSHYMSMNISFFQDKRDEGCQMMWALIGGTSASRLAPLPEGRCQNWTLFLALPKKSSESHLQECSYVNAFIVHTEGTTIWPKGLCLDSLLEKGTGKLPFGFGSVPCMMELLDHYFVLYK